MFAGDAFAESPQFPVTGRAGPRAFGLGQGRDFRRPRAFGDDDAALLVDKGGGLAVLPLPQPGGGARPVERAGLGDEDEAVVVLPLAGHGDEGLANLCQQVEARALGEIVEQQRGLLGRPGHQALPERRCAQAFEVEREDDTGLGGHQREPRPQLRHFWRARLSRGVEG